ncbi:haloalkane dehalogenase [Marinobacter bryozoorum]|jgi:haloalkane dehalogenase|uniref:haloalkane dehalogenase n=1 Tax=Marinobacter bryozoorum TaxID=256324 RepID=UPI002002E395|nr:haloalkane dehalogenase [Marinobacter bryozoorum]MCK7543893.1 haloalkane dehalogenase [Marinobacter bryozoorum]
MRILRTDESRFRDLPDFPFPPHYVEVGTELPLRLHYVDHGPEKAAPVVLLHGEHGWAYLYRHMIPLVAGAGLRALAPDLIGFGRSDKPEHQQDYSFDRHLDWLEQWLLALDLNNVTLVCQNRTSLLALALVMRQPDRFSRIIAANAVVPGEDETRPPAHSMWQMFARYSPWFPVPQLIQLGTTRPLTRAERDAYDAPFPSDRYKAGARSFASTLGQPHKELNRQRLWRFLEGWQKPFITCFSDSDPGTRGGHLPLQRKIPGALGQPHITLSGGHFLQEDAAESFARVIIDACRPSLAA